MAVCSQCPGRYDRGRGERERVKERGKEKERKMRETDNNGQKIGDRENEGRRER